MTVRSYLPWEAAEIARLCYAYGVPEQAQEWLAEAYSLHEVEANLRTSAAPSKELMCEMLTPQTGQGAPAATAVNPESASIDPWREVRAANAARLSGQARW
jgi:hypothetical protein